MDGVVQKVTRLGVERRIRGWRLFEARQVVAARRFRATCALTRRACRKPSSLPLSYLLSLRPIAMCHLVAGSFCFDLSPLAATGLFLHCRDCMHILPPELLLRFLPSPGDRFFRRAV